jgi:catechol 2,3-dioxygenase-like lactoylglutathione lyase family enzyme
MATATTFVEQAETTARSSLIRGFNHVAAVTHDLDRLTAFYRDVFDVPFVPIPTPDIRHGFLLLGDMAPNGGLGPILHVFEATEDMTGELPDATAIFRRGRLDHIALDATDEFALAELRDRLVAAGASDGVVRVFGGHYLSVHVEDPDGMQLEVGCNWTGDVFGESDVVREH